MAVLSKRDDRCEACNDPLFVCPSTIRVSIRCCTNCTHRTKLDVEHEDFLRWQADYRKRNP